MSRRFAAIFMVHTLKHCDDPVWVRRRAGGWLTDSGRMFDVVPNGDAAWRQIVVHIGHRPHNDAVTNAERDRGHRRTYRLDTLERGVRDAGLRSSHTGGVVVRPPTTFHVDSLIGSDVVSEDSLEGRRRPGRRYPELCASTVVECERGSGRP